MEQFTAEVLQEPNLPLLRSVVRILGHDRTAAVLVDTLQRAKKALQQPQAETASA